MIYARDLHNITHEPPSTCLMTFVYTYLDAKRGLIDVYRFSDIDECSRPDACGNNAICRNTPGNYTCDCQQGFVGNPYDGVIILRHYYNPYRLYSLRFNGPDSLVRPRVSYIIIFSLVSRYYLARSTAV